jgi:hypothetical protein
MSHIEKDSVLHVAYSDRQHDSGTGSQHRFAVLC